MGGQRGGGREGEAVDRSTIAVDHRDVYTFLLLYAISKVRQINLSFIILMTQTPFPKAMHQFSYLIIDNTRKL